jgi:hypothetical protein
VAFSGQARTLSEKVSSLAAIGDATVELSLDKLLGKLPATRVVNGHVVPIRAEVQATVRPGGTGAPAGWRPEGHDAEFVLQVKYEDGTGVLPLHVGADASFGDIRRLIDHHRGFRQPYEIRGAFPSRAFSDDAMTLRESGLPRRAVIMLKTR